MKKILLSLTTILSGIVFSQIYFAPQSNYNFGQNYQASITGNGTIYYTLDGSEPTLNSSFGENNIDFNITENTLVKAKLKTGENTLSNTFIQKFWHTLIEKNVFFKPPTTWSGQPCSYMNWLDPQTTIDFYPPGQKMTEACEGWYKMTYSFGKPQIHFNNCLLPQSPSYVEYTIVTEDTVYYDSSTGSITNPPACLLGTQESSKIANVKIAENPVKDILQIKSDVKFENYQIVDISGKIIAQRNFEKEINVSQLQKGIYIIKLLGNNAVQHYLKFIKN